MKIKRLKVSNFRAIKNVAIEDLDDTVVIARPNGSGKSCIFDAIRLLKSGYGGYDPNEIHQWFSEFQIDINRLREELPRLLNDQSKHIIIEADFLLSDAEREYLVSETEDVAENLARRIVGRDRGDDQRQVSVLAQRFERPEVLEKRDGLVASIRDELAHGDLHTGRLELSQHYEQWNDSAVLMACFSTFNPERLGIIEYHSATRNYAREQFGGLQLNIRDQRENIKQHSLYNTGNISSNIKSEMASAYVRELLASAAGVTIGDRSTIVKSLQEMFADFFDGKSFQGGQFLLRTGICHS
jgi:predicted ATP-dependent endonuclease of OLD family